MNMQEVSIIIASALKSVVSSKGEVFKAQRACVSFAREHQNWLPMSRLIVGLHNSKVYNGKALLDFVLQTCGSDKQGKGGALGWREKGKSLFIRQDMTVEPIMFTRLETKPFYEHKVPSPLTYVSVDIIRASVARVEKNREDGKLEDWVPSDDRMIAELQQVLAKYNRHLSKKELKEASAA